MWGEYEDGQPYGSDSHWMWRAARAAPATYPDLCGREVQGEAERRRLVESEGALFVPLSLAHLCLRLVGRLSTVEAAFWEAVEQHRAPAGLRPYTVVAMSSVPAEQIKLWAFPVHPAKLTRPSLRFSVDLVQGVIDYLRVIAAVSMRDERQKSVQLALDCYRLHLSRVARPERRPEDMPRAVLDVEEVWLSHMIRTRNYDEVCRLTFGALVDHRLPETTSLLLDGGDSKPIQERREGDVVLTHSYSSPQRSNRDDDLQPDDVLKDQVWFTQFMTHAVLARERWEGKPPTRPPARTGVTRMSQAKVAETVEWFCERLREPVRPGGDGDSISLADQMLLGYERMIYLLARYPHRSKQFTPGFLVGLVWRAHQVHPVAYRRDMQRVAGMVFEHHPWSGTAPGGGGSQLSQQRSIELWTEEFSKESFIACEITGLFRD